MSRRFGYRLAKLNDERVDVPPLALSLVGLLCLVSRSGVWSAWSRPAAGQSRTRTGAGGVAAERRLTPPGATPSPLEPLVGGRRL